MPDEPQTPPPAPEAPAENPYEVFDRLGLRPDDPELEAKVQWMNDLANEHRRADAIAHLAESDPRVRDRLAGMFTPKEEPQAAPNPFAPGDEYQDPGQFVDPQAFERYLDDRAGRIADQRLQSVMQRLEASEQQAADARVQDYLWQQANSIEGLTAGQRDEVFGRAYQRYQNGELTQSNFQTVAQDTLQQIRSVWAPPVDPTPPAGSPGDPTALARMVAAQQAGSPSLGQGMAPTGGESDVPGSAAELVARMRAEGVVQ